MTSQGSAPWFRDERFADADLILTVATGDGQEPANKRPRLEPIPVNRLVLIGQSSVFRARIVGQMAPAAYRAAADQERPTLHMELSAELLAVAPAVLKFMYGGSLPADDMPQLLAAVLLLDFWGVARGPEEGLKALRAAAEARQLSVDDLAVVFALPPGLADPVLRRLAVDCLVDHLTGPAIGLQAVQLARRLAREVARPWSLLAPVEPSLVALLGDEDCRGRAAAALRDLYADLCQGGFWPLLDADATFPRLWAVLRRPPAPVVGDDDDDDWQAVAAEALDHLAEHCGRDRLSVWTEPDVQQLIEMIGDGPGRRRAVALRLLKDLVTTSDDACLQIVTHGGVAALTAVLDKGGDEETEWNHAGLVLLHLLQACRDLAIVKLSAAGTVGKLVALLPSQAAQDALCGFASEWGEKIAVETGEALVRLLGSVDPASRMSALHVLNEVAEYSLDAVGSLIDAGAAEPLVRVLEDMPEGCELALDTLARMSRKDAGRLVAAGAVGPLFALLQRQSEDDFTGPRWLSAVRALDSMILTGGGVARLPEDAVQKLVAALGRPRSDAIVSWAASMLACLSEEPSARAAAVTAGAVKALVPFTPGLNRGVDEVAWALRTLTEDDPGVAALTAVPGAAPALRIAVGDRRLSFRVRRDCAELLRRLKRSDV